LSDSKQKYHPLLIEGHCSLHSYLDTVFKNSNPNNEDIIAAKKKYWQEYYRIYRKNYRQRYKEYRLHFDGDTLKQINIRKGKLSVSKFLYQCVLQSLKGESDGSTDVQKSISAISHQLLKIIYLLEEHLDNDTSRLTPNIIQRIETLESDIQTLTSSLSDH